MPRRGPIVGSNIHVVGCRGIYSHLRKRIFNGRSQSVGDEVRRPHPLNHLLIYQPSALFLEAFGLNPNVSGGKRPGQPCYGE